MELSFRLVDVFTERPFAGNQLCVVPETPSDLEADTMQAVAQEIGFSETTFVTSAGGDRYAMRIFTPASELPFAGHPTIGTAFTLAAEGRIEPRATQTVPGGDVPVEVDVEAGEAWMTQFPPLFGERFDDRELVGRATGLGPDDLDTELPIQVVSTGLAPILVPVRDEAALRRAERHGAACAEVVERADAECLYLFAVRGDGDVMARMFDPLFGIGEDPATGSAAGALAAYLGQHGRAGLPGRAVIAQGELVGRPSFLQVDVAREDGELRVRVGGGVRSIGEGRFRW